MTAGKVLIVTVYFLKNLETSTQKTHAAHKYIKRTFLKTEKSLCMKMLLSTRAKPAQAEAGNQSAFILYVFSEVTERFLLKHANINLICGRIGSQPNWKHEHRTSNNNVLPSFPYQKMFCGLIMISLHLCSSYLGFK